MNNRLSPAPPPTDSPYQDIDNPQAKDHLLVVLLSVFLGALGVDRFYLGYITSGIIKLLVGCSLPILGGIIAVFVAVVNEAELTSAGTVIALVLAIVVLLAMCLTALIWYIADMIRITTKRLQPKDGDYKD